MEKNLMRIPIVTLTLGVGLICTALTQLPPPSPSGPGLLQGSIAISSAAKRKQPRSTPPAAMYGPRPHFGGPADPSFGPDGKPYKVPEYLRNQCYIDEGYGRFSACSNRL
jgi:hypothetical protein